MNKTMIALIAVSLGALLPVPTAQAVDPICTEEVEEFLTPFVSGDPVQKDVCVKQLPAVPEVGSCDEGKIGLTFGAREVCARSDGIDPCKLLEGCGVEVPGQGPHHPCRPEGYSEDDGGFGGTHATCYYACKKLDLLGIIVTAEDPDADVSGYTDCGGAYATCPRSPQRCVGASDGLAQGNDADQGCVGDSHEIVSSRITVTCVAAGRGIVCQLTGLDCGTVVSAASASSFCNEQNSVVPPDVMARLLATLPEGPISSFVSFEYERIDGFLSGFVIQWDGSDCWAGAL